MVQKRLDAVVRPVLLKYKITHIPSMLEFVTALSRLLGAAAHKLTVQSELEKTKHAVVEAKKKQAAAAEANVKLLDKLFARHKSDMSRLTTELAPAKARVAELERYGTTAAANIITERTAAQEASTTVFDLEGRVTNLNRQVDNVVSNAVATARLRVDHIHNLTGGGASSDPSGSPKNGAGGTGGS